MRASEHLPERWNAAAWFIGRHVDEGRGHRVAIVTDESSLTYAQLDEQVRRFSGALAAAGLHPGDRVALGLPDGLLFSVAFWGTLAAGAVAVPVSTFIDAAAVAAVLADCEPQLVVGDGGTWSVDEAWRRVAAAAPAPYARTHRDALGFLLYTSGTTGEPKGVVHRARDMWVCARAFGEHVLGVREGDRAFSASKLFFAYGLGNAQYYPFSVGASCVLAPGRATAELILDHIRRHRPTLLFGVPATWAQLLAALDAGAAADFSGVRLCISAGEALPASLFERWRENTGLELLDGIGSTEACQTFISNRPGAALAGSSGVIVPGYEARVVDADGRDVAVGEVGDLLVRGDSILAFYWNRADASRRALAGEWLRTGDRYHVDAGGAFWHHGRSDELFKVGGAWVSPVEVERELAAHPAVLECAVVPRHDGGGLTRAHAVVVLRDGAAASAGELIAFARERLSSWKCPRSVSFAASLPRTATGKLRRFLLAEK